MTKAFLDLCLREKAKMNMDGQYMSRLGWRNIKKDFATYAEEKLTAKQLQNKFTSLKKTFELWKKLKNETGAGYDSTTGMIINDAAWWKKMEGVQYYYSGFICNKIYIVVYSMSCKVSIDLLFS